MKRRVALIVGCNEYTYLPNLFGASKDASEFYETLTSPSLGAYDKELSQLVLSPDLNQFRDALNDVLFCEHGIDVFTLFFAGHGGVKSGSYYLGLRDTRPDRMSTTAHPLNALFTIINESRPTQVNIIIDACNAGGLVGDLVTLLKADLIGEKGSPSIALLAGSSADEYANETSDGGVVSNLMLECLTGVKKLNSTSPFLDLADIGKYISQTIDSQHKQMPTSWGLNLYGQSKFSHNPHFAESGLQNSGGFGDILPSSEIGKTISQHADEIWEEFRAIGDEPEAYRLANTLEKIIGEFSNDPKGVAAFIGGIANTLEQQATKSQDAFGAITVVSVLLTVLLQYADDVAVQTVATRLLERRRELIHENVALIFERQNKDQYYLLGPGEGGAELFLLPIRIHKILGHIWSQILIDKINGVNDLNFVGDVRRLTNMLFKSYADSFVAVSDEQGPYLYIVARATDAVGEAGAISNIFDFIFRDVIRHKGSLADAHLEPSEILRFLLNRYHNKERSAPEILANPSQLISVLLSLKVDAALENEWDKTLRSLDHQALVVFIPTSFNQFGLRTIRDGTNNAFKVGHGIWCLEDFRREFAAECRPTLLRNESWKNSNVQILSIVASLAFPDRIPWFIECMDSATHST